MRIVWALILAALLAMGGLTLGGAFAQDEAGDEAAADGSTLVVPDASESDGEVEISVTSVQIGASWSDEKPDEDLCWIAIRGTMPSLDQERYAGYLRNPRITEATGPDGEAIALPAWELDPEDLVPLPRRTSISVYLSFSDLPALPSRFSTLTGVIYGLEQTASERSEIDIAGFTGDNADEARPEVDPATGLTLRVEEVDATEDDRISVLIRFIRTDAATGAIAQLPIATFAEVLVYDQDDARLSRARGPQTVSDSANNMQVRYFFNRDYDQRPTTVRIAIPTEVQLTPYTFELNDLRLPAIR